LSAQATKSDWDAAEEVKIADRAFMKFRERIADNPDQVCWGIIWYSGLISGVLG